MTIHQMKSSSVTSFIKHTCTHPHMSVTMITAPEIGSYNYACNVSMSRNVAVYDADNSTAESLEKSCMCVCDADNNTAGSLVKFCMCV